MKRIPEETRIQQINALSNIKFIRWENGYSDSKSKAVCQCEIDGHTWANTIDRTLNAGVGCPQCSRESMSIKFKTPENTRIAQINATPNVSFVRWVDGYKNSSSKAVCRCSVCGCEWVNMVNSIINAGRGCANCSGKRRWTAEESIAQINKLKNISFVRWDGRYQGKRTKAVCRCALDGFEWSTAVDKLRNEGTGCPKCAGNIRINANERISQINSLAGISFIGWADGYKNAHSKAVCKCGIDGYEWQATSTDLINRGTGCPQCAGLVATPSGERIAQINARQGITFVRWHGEYNNSHSKAVCRCDVDGCEWTATISAIVNHKTGCPQCADKGYNPAKSGTLYVLRSECGSMVKIGISNNYKRRHIELRRATPFDWHCIELLHNNDGAFIAKAEKELHSLTEQAQFSEPFDGYTEWRKWDDRIPMLIEEYRARA